MEWGSCEAHAINCGHGGGIRLHARGGEAVACLAGSTRGCFVQFGGCTGPPTGCAYHEQVHGQTAYGEEQAPHCGARGSPVENLARGGQGHEGAPNQGCIPIIIVQCQACAPNECQARTTATREGPPAKASGQVAAASNSGGVTSQATSAIGVVAVAEPGPQGETSGQRLPSEAVIRRWRRQRSATT